MSRLPILLCCALLLGACHKAEPHASAANRYEADRIRTLTHDEDLARPAATEDFSHVQLPASPSQNPAR